MRGPALRSPDGEAGFGTILPSSSRAPAWSGFWSLTNQSPRNRKAVQPLAEAAATAAARPRTLTAQTLRPWR